MSEPEYALISIVSEQPMPNVMAVLQDKRYFKYLDFIVSADKDEPSVYDKSFEKIYDRLKIFLEKRNRIVTKQRPVYPYSLQDVLNVCQEAVDEHRLKGHEVVFNITGGTKVMALAAYLCAQRNQAEAIYVESRDRRLITLLRTDNVVDIVTNGVPGSKDEPFDESLFHEIDVCSYVELYGRKVVKCVTGFPEEQITRANLMAQYYKLLRKRFIELRSNFRHQPKAKEEDYFSVDITNVSKREKEGLEVLSSNGIFFWDSEKSRIYYSKEQYHFINGIWVEVFTFNSLASSGLFQNVLANVKLGNSDDEWDVMLTVNATFAIIECKSDAEDLNARFGKVRSIQRDLGGTYAKSFFVRSADDREKKVKQQAALYGINKVLDRENMFNLVEEVARVLNVSIK
jgi:hypothetical protein